jgi:predicted nucleotidyltransferase
MTAFDDLKLSPEEREDAFPFHTVLAAYRGSIAHGMYIPPTDPNAIDDKDIMAVSIAPIDHYLGLKKFTHRTRFIREYDIVVYEFRRFVELLMQSNPNVLSMLWVAKKHQLLVREPGRQLVNNRHLFATKAIYRSFTGYAYGQLQKMTHCAFEGYMGAKRKALVEEFGYDTKCAAHTIRLLRMGIEFLTDGELYVERHDAKQLLEIKKGKWTLDEVKDEAERLRTIADEAYVRSDLPKQPDPEKVNALVVDVLCSQFDQTDWTMPGDLPGDAEKRKVFFKHYDRLPEGVKCPKS